MSPTRRLLDLFGIALPIVQAPMAGAQDEELAIAVARVGGMGSIPCAMLSPDEARAQVLAFRRAVRAPVHLNFFCHAVPEASAAEGRWRDLFASYYTELGVEVERTLTVPARAPFDERMCALVEELRVEVISFQFGLPRPELFDRVRASGARIVGTATTVAEAQALEAAGCDAIVAQGAEAGGHRGMFLTDDVGSQVGTFALVPQAADAVRIPVIAAGGIADGRGVAAAIALGAAGVQAGTAFLRCPESRVSSVHRSALEKARDGDTRITNVVTGRPARGIVNRVIREIGPMRTDVPAFPRAAAALAPLRARAEELGSGDFSPLWAGQAASLAVARPAGEVTMALAAGALDVARRVADELT